MKRLFPILLITLAALITRQPVLALDIKITPGALAKSAESLRTTRDETVKITGTASAEDLALMRRISKHVHTLDISGLVLPGDALPEYFLFDTRVSRVLLPETLKSIGAYAFAASGLTVYTMPASVTSVGDYAFAGCADLNVISLQGTPTLGKGLFKDCARLAKIVFASSPTAIPESAFENCRKLEIEIPASVKTIGAKAFSGTAIKDADLRKVKTVGAYAFANCFALSSIEIDAAEAPAFGTGAFFMGSTLSSFPAFSGDLPALFAADAVSNLSLPSPAPSPELQIDSRVVGDAAFAGNRNISSIRLGQQVKQIKKNAFRNCTRLTQIGVSDLGATVPEVDPGSFSGLENEDGRYDIRVLVKNGNEEIWKAHPVWSLFEISGVTGTETPSMSREEADIRVTRDGADILISSNMPLDNVDIYSLSGSLLYSATPDADTFTASGIAEGEVAVVRVRSGNAVKVVKLL